MAKNTREAVDNSVLAGPTLVVRKLHPLIQMDEVTMEQIASTELQQEVKEHEMLYFAEGWVANDHPRDLWLTEELLKGTDLMAANGEEALFGVARSDSGAIVKTFRTLSAAEAASAGARVELGVAVEIDDEGEKTVNEERQTVDPADWA